MVQLGEVIGRQVAHDTVYEACMKAYEEKVPLKEYLKRNGEITKYLTDEDLDKLFDIQKYIGYSVEYADRVAAKTKQLLEN